LTTYSITHAKPIANIILLIFNRALDPRSPRLYPTKANIYPKKANIGPIMKPESKSTKAKKSANALAMV